MFSVLVPLAAVTVFLGTAELLLRWLAPLHPIGIKSAFEYDTELGYRLAPGVNRDQVTDHREEIRTNTLGTVNFQERFDQYPVLVFAIGDSYTQGTGNSSDTSYPFQLDLLLNQDSEGRYQKRFGVVNLGTAGFGTEQYLIVLERYAQLLGPPDYILYLGCDNDWQDDLLLRRGYRHQHVVAGSAYWGRWAAIMLWLEHFELVKRAKAAASQWRKDYLLNDAIDQQGTEVPPISTAQQVWPTVQRIASLSRQWNSRLILSWANPDGGSYEWLKAKAASEHIPFADWEPRVRSVMKNMPGLAMENPHSGAHWQPWTNGEIAQAFAHAMEAR